MCLVIVPNMCVIYLLNCIAAGLFRNGAATRSNNESSLAAFCALLSRDLSDWAEGLLIRVSCEMGVELKATERTGNAVKVEPLPIFPTPTPPFVCNAWN